MTTTATPAGGNSDAGVIEIPLSRGMVALIDAIDSDRVVSLGKWFAIPSSATFYAATTKPTVRMHVLITGQKYMDHVNGDGLDNRRANLRSASRSQNSMNRRMRSNNKSGFKGVYWHARAGRWIATIATGGQKIHLGSFLDPESAAHAYDDAALAHFGEFARFNFRDGAKA